VRLAGRRSLAVDDVHDFTAIVFGVGDYRTRTEFRASPPVLTAGDSLALGPLNARVLRVLHHPRFVSLRFDGSPDEIWAGIARHGRPIQYARVGTPLEMWDGWTRVAGLPAAFESPSATFVLDWTFLERLVARGVGFATLTHAAGISSTGDAELDAGLPWDEAYCIPESTFQAIAPTRARGGRVVAIGSSVTRALEHAASSGGGVRAGSGVATQRIGPRTKLRVVDAVLSGAHEPEESHYQLLRAFASDAVFRRMTADLNRENYHSHEYGDSVFVQGDRVSTAAQAVHPWCKPAKRVKVLQCSEQLPASSG